MKITNTQFIKILQCPHCSSERVSIQPACLVCTACQSTYAIKNSTLFMISLKNNAAEQYEREILSPINKLKSFVKRWPSLFTFITYACGGVSFFGQSPQKTIKKVFGEHDIENKIIINIGSGTKIIHPSVINFDIFPFKNVDIVADAMNIPFQDNSVDMIISESTLEHTPDADRAIQEMARVIKPGGFVYVSIPFLMPFHASPNDYMRLTHEGLKQKFSKFRPKKVGVRGGPMSTLVTFLMHFLALPFSLISDSIYHFFSYLFMIILSPLRIFDLLFYLFPRSIEISSYIYLIGEKTST